MVWVHGGGFSGGDKTSGEIVSEATDMAKKGYFNVSINYRLYGPGCSAAGGGSQVGCIQAMIDAQHDAQAAVRFLRKNAATYKIDPNRIAMGGSSAGAITALHVAANSEDPGTSGNPGFSSAIKAAVSLSGREGHRRADDVGRRTDPDVPRHRGPARAVPVGGQHAEPGERRGRHRLPHHLPG